MTLNVRITHTVDQLDRDMRAMPKRAAVRMATLVRRNAEIGNRRAKAFAEKSAGSHGRHYPKSFIVEPDGSLAWVYGPHPSLAQGEMSFEFGSRKQPPHLDLAKSADIVGPKMANDVRKMVDRLFWP